METRAIAKYIRVAPQKARLVAKNVRGLPVEKAMNILKFTPNKSANILFDVIHSALANAEHNTGLDIDTLIVKEVLVNEGPTWKRFMPRSQGRANKIRKRTSHITVVLGEG
ncbi:MAG: 50S ribosomal protein L22 [Desulfovibrionaceae bacterium]